MNKKLLTPKRRQEIERTIKVATVSIEEFGKASVELEKLRLKAVLASMLVMQIPREEGEEFVSTPEGKLLLETVTEKVREVIEQVE